MFLSTYYMHIYLLNLADIIREKRPSFAVIADETGKIIS